MTFQFPLALPTDWKPWILAIVTVAALVWLSWLYTLAQASTRWPHVQGRVLRAWVEDRWWADPPYHSPRVEYT